jgi:short-subunit dehydrogenase
VSKLHGRVVAVTGGARGIGREIAAQLARAGASVAIGDRDGAAAAARELSGTVAGFDLDVTDTASFTAFLDAVEARLGPLDVLVNNAGVMWVGPFAEEPESSTIRQLEVNLHGVIRGVKLAAPRFVARGHGHVVTIASAASKVAPPGEATYAATKHGVYGYLTAVREELRRTGVELSVVMPGVVETELAAGTTSGGVKRLQPTDVARTVLSLIERPRFEAFIPARIGLLTRVNGLLPDRLRTAMARALVPNQIESADPSARDAYQARELGARGKGATR